MKVKELAVIFNVGVEELLDLLYNVGVNIDLQEEAMVNKDIEKKLAKRYNVEYPFKTNKTKKPTPNENPVQQQPVKNTGNTQPTQPKKEQPKQEENEVKQPEVKIIEPVRIMKTIKTEEVKPRVDEDTLAKYAD